MIIAKSASHRRHQLQGRNRTDFSVGTVITEELRPTVLEQRLRLAVRSFPVSCLAEAVGSGHRLRLRCAHAVPSDQPRRGR
jgi:hypothetical protein